MACVAAASRFESYSPGSAFGSITSPWQAPSSKVGYQQGGLEPYPTGIWVPESLKCDFLPPGVTRVLAVTDRCPYNMRLRSEWVVRDFVLVKEIGTGNASTVWYAFCKKTSAPLAIKTYKKRKLSPLNRCQVAREINIHAQLDHPNVIALYAAFEDNDKVYLLQEFAEGGDLFDEMKRTLGRMPEAQLVTSVLLPMMSALLAMHSLGFIHRDVKPENTLFAAGRVLKLADFGLAVNHLMERPVTRLGTLDYMAPEVLVCPDKHMPSDNKQRSELWYTPAVDAWALGVLAYELAVGRPPFGMSTRDETIRAIQQSPPSFPEFMSPGLVDYISSALVKPSGQRSSLAELMAHPWILEHARRAGMEGQVLAYLKVHQPERQLLMAAAPTAGNSASLQQQQQQADAATAAAAVASGEAQRLHQMGAAAASAGMLPAGGGLAPAMSAPSAGARCLASPAASGSLHAAVAAAAAAAAAGGRMPPSAAAAAAANYLAGLVGSEQLAFGGAEFNTAAGSAAIAGGAAAAGPRVKKTAKRTNMPRCFSSRNVAGLGSLAGLASHQHQPQMPHGHIHWHANGEELALHVPGLLLDLGGSCTPRTSSQGTNSPPAAAAAAAAGGYLPQLRLPKQASLQHLSSLVQQSSLQQELNSLQAFAGMAAGGAEPNGQAPLSSLLAGLPGMQQQLLPGSPTRRFMAASRLTAGSSGSSGSKAGGNSKRCTPEPDSDLAVTLLALGQQQLSPTSSLGAADAAAGGSCSGQLSQQLMQQYLRQQQMQLPPTSMAAAGSCSALLPSSGASTAAATAHCQLHGYGYNQSGSPNASPSPRHMSRLGACSSAGGTCPTLSTGLGQQQQQQQGYNGLAGQVACSCSCGSGSSSGFGGAVSIPASCSGRTTGAKYSPCSPVLKQVVMHQFESPLKRVNSQGTLSGLNTSSGPALVQQLSLPLLHPHSQQQFDQQQVAGVMMAADLDRMQHAAAADLDRLQYAAAAAAAVGCSSAPTLPPASPAAAAVQHGALTQQLQVQLPGGGNAAANASSAMNGVGGSSGGRRTSESLEGTYSAAPSPAGLHLQELAAALCSPGSVANLLNPAAVQQQMQQHRTQQQAQVQMQQRMQAQHQAQQQQQQVCSKRVSAMRRPVARACSAPSLLHPALQLQLLQAQQQQQLLLARDMNGTSPPPHVLAPAGDDCFAAAVEQQYARQQQQLLGDLTGLLHSSIPGSPITAGPPCSQADLLHHAMSGSAAAAAAAEQVQLGSSGLLSSPPLFRASSPGLAMLHQSSSGQLLRSGSSSWDAAAAAGSGTGGTLSPQSLQQLSPAAAAAAAAYAGVMAAAGDAALSPMHGVCSSSAREGASMITRSHSFLCELGPLQPISESVATYEALPAALMSPTWQQQQHMQTTEQQQHVQMQQQQQEQDVCSLYLQHQMQQQVQHMAEAIAVQQQQQLGCTGSGACPSSPDAFSPSAMACSPNGPAAAASTSPLNARMLARPNPSRLAQASSALHDPACN